MILTLLIACSSPSCPPEMAAVMDGETIAYCIDRYEVVIKDPQGRAYPDGTPVFLEGSTTASVANVVPSGAVTFLEARTLCATTPALHKGKEYAKKHLTTEAEWRDAADGKVGTGGRRWPYGNRYDPRKCNVPENGATAVAPTGAFPECRTESGIYDQVGNLFEWLDPGLTVQTDLALAHFQKLGYGLTVEGGQWLHATPETRLDQLDSEATAINRSSLRRDETGQLWMTWQGTVEDPLGFLTLHNEDLNTPETTLPIRFMTTPGQPEARLRLERELGGSPIPEKAGGAWYQGGNWPNPRRNHTAFFRGSIGFRCAAPPSP
ncbi:MAG TPA: SUMF1/EgtB/PvdO family nonheme iron enzyme [Myxococcota bacterium]|nr:SUMF1/EgtB/PvdO family nonheme iron enzyme [Myxococcota bacterium]